MTYLVDSHYVADYLKGRSPAVTLLNTLLQDDLAISMITFAEIYEGIYYGHDPKHATTIFKQFLRGAHELRNEIPISRRNEEKGG